MSTVTADERSGSTSSSSRPAEGSPSSRRVRPPGDRRSRSLTLGRPPGVERRVRRGRAARCVRAPVSTGSGEQRAVRRARRADDTRADTGSGTRAQPSVLAWQVLRNPYHSAESRFARDLRRSGRRPGETRAGRYGERTRGRRRRYGNRERDADVVKMEVRAFTTTNMGHGELYGPHGTIRNSTDGEWKDHTHYWSGYQGGGAVRQRRGHHGPGPGPGLPRGAAPAGTDSAVRAARRRRRAGDGDRCPGHATGESAAPPTCPVGPSPMPVGVRSAPRRATGAAETVLGCWE